jgi:hypothetical protein
MHPLLLMANSKKLLHQPKNANMKIVVAKTFDNYFSANIFLTKLQSAGIECYLQDEFTVTIDPMLSNAIGGIKLVVKEEDEPAEMEQLRQYDEAYMNAATCSGCGGHHLSYIAKQSVPNFLTAIFTWLFSNYAAAPDYVYQCGDCGYETSRLPEKEDAEL